MPETPFDHERVVDVLGGRSGVPIVVAVHSTRLGPALGGTRIWNYPDRFAAQADVLRLSAGMTAKVTFAGLHFGGGKAVIAAPPDGLAGDRRRAALLDLGDLVAEFDGGFTTADDVGSSPEDMRVIRERTEHVHSLPADLGGLADPSEPTTIAAHEAIRATAEHLFDGVAGRRLVIVGLGKIGSRLARLLTADGAVLTVTDIDPARKAVAEEVGATWAEPADALTIEADVLVPAALGGLLTAEVIDGLAVRAVAGPANNQLADRAGADRLHARGITYAPDFVVSSGGVVHAALRSLGRQADADAAVRANGARLRDLLVAAAAAGSTPLAAAEEINRRRLAAGT